VALIEDDDASTKAKFFEVDLSKDLKQTKTVHRLSERKKRTIKYKKNVYKIAQNMKPK
jgi:hypothetical protein